MDQFEPPDDQQGPGPSGVSTGDSRYADWLTAIWVGGILSLLCYRAVNQAITYDEAVTWRAFVDGPFSEAYNWDFGNHFLFTLLAKGTTALLGISEFTLRLPTLFGAVLYLASIWLLTRRVLPSAGRRLGCIALLTLNPLVLDYLCAARGYGIALGLFMMAAYLLHTAAEVVDSRRQLRILLIAGVLLGLTACASLPFLTPILGLGVGFVMLVFFDRRPGKPRWRRVLRAGLCVSLPAAVVSLALLLPFMMQFGNTGGLGSFPGLDTPWQALRSFFCGAVLSRWCPVWATRNTEHQGWVGPAADWGAYCLLIGLPVVALAHAAMGVHRKVLRKHMPDPGGSPQDDRRRNLQFLMGVSAVGWLLFSAVLHAAAGLSYALDRGIIFLVPTLTLACFLIGRGSPAAQGAKARLGRWAKAAITLSVVALYAFQLRVDWFREWRYDAGSRRVYEQIAERAKGVVAVGSLWCYTPSLEFYILNMNGSQYWMQHSFGAESKWYLMKNTLLSDGNYLRSYDFFVLNEDVLDPNWGVNDAIGTEVYRDPVSGEMLIWHTRSPLMFQHPAP
jgi:hypothetical protein